MKILIIVVSVLFYMNTTPAYSNFMQEVQIIDTINCIPDDSTETIYTIVEQMPSFTGGNEALKEYLIKNLKYPEKAIKDSIQGKVFVTFVVGQSGEIKDVKVLRGLTDELNQEAIRVVSDMPTWAPGKQSGKNVNVQYNLPIHFKL